jgi:vitamin-K-epoxide reductase (warfarin-sensitive)
MRYVLALLAVLGLTVSYLALRVHYSNDIQPCDINDHWDCGVVNHSPFAMVGPIPVASIGIAGYVLIGILALLRRRVLVAAASVVGLGFALYLTHIEKDVLMVWCLYCVISQCIILLLFLLSIGWFWAGRKARA